ncbi:Tm-1-like ATP-binding domain-containing protein [Rathayibacter sp. VKM Ac-2754]|uniref:Tm-1-like ATP-binding domain-containing protein n=1 Tax=Rathayibacter sp. VKM Ac-2754 TaxID=2609251 RepID=UPI001356A248|nr:Tm-1-like ATP-binding domain-containing protein [Rathayibacter sp. VKM Ac-2754]MWV59397.1 UPF0261 family protein [Rathayibacter sp. VKM Ac-2754]
MARSPRVALVGTLDTKGDEYAWMAERLTTLGVDVVLVDVGIGAHRGPTADVTAAETARAAGADLDALRTGGDRGTAMTAMGEGAAVVLDGLQREGRLDGVLALAGSGGTSIAARAIRDLPLGLPKLLVSTMASGDVSPYVGASDVTMTYSVVDIAGINSLSREILDNAAGAIAGMAASFAARREAPAHESGRPLIAATMFGVTTPAVDVARARLDELGYEVLVFHATGSGGRAVEALARSGHLAGVLDLTTTELADELVGGVLTAGPERLEAAGRAGLPQVVSLGALDMVNFGPRESVPERFRERLLLVHNPTVTLMRTTAAESAELGALIARKLVAATGPTVLAVPRGGVSAIDVPGGVFADSEALAALLEAALAGVAGSHVQVIDSPLAINDPEFARAAADALDALLGAPRPGRI